MGGWGSGKRWDSKSTTDSYIQLDARRLQRERVLDRRYSFNWQWSRDGEVVSNIDIRPEQDRIILTYRHRRSGQEWERREYPVRLERTACHYGGERVWFLCPGLGCGKRVAILYGGEVFACRHCYCLAYASQRESHGDRADSRAWAIRKRCGGWGSLFDPLLRPKGMHNRTFRQLERSYTVAIGCSEAAFAKRMGMSIEDALNLG